MRPFHEIEEALKISDFKREWYGKQTKLSKLYWTLLFNCYRYHLSIDIASAVSAYKFLFYKPEEVHYWIIGHYDGVPTREIRKLKPKPIELMGSYETRSAKHAVELETLLFEEYSDHIMDSKGAYEEIGMPLDSFDDRHPHLEKVSTCLLLLIEDKGIPLLSKNTAIVGDFDLKPSQVKKLNSVLRQLTEIDLLWLAARYLQDFTNRKGNFFSKIEVNGATDALEDAISSNPDLMQHTDKRIGYLLDLKYREIGGAPLGSIQKAIKRMRS